MERKLMERNIKLYTWHVALKEPLFWGPILVTSFIHLGKMSLEEVYAMEAIVLLGKLVLEIPSGALADYLGRRRTVILGSIVHFVSMAWFMSISSPQDVWISNILWVIGASLCSGADNSLLRDSLKEFNLEYEYLRIKGNALSQRLLLTGFASLAVGFLADFDLRLPLLLSIPAVFVSSLLTCYFTEPGERERKMKFTYMSFFELCLQLKLITTFLNKLMRMSVLFVANNKKVKWIVGYSTIIGVSSKVWFFTYNPYFELVELDIKWYGVMFFVLNMIAWFFSKHAHTIKARIGEYNSVLLMLICIGVPILVMGLCVSTLAVSMILLENITRGLSVPFFSDMLHNQITSENRATIDSVGSAINGTSQFIALMGFKYLLVFWSLPVALSVLGFVTLLLGAIGAQKYKKFFS